jgi:hypothetical protein
MWLKLNALSQSNVGCLVSHKGIFIFIWDIFVDFEGKLRNKEISQVNYCQYINKIECILFAFFTMFALRVKCHWLVKIDTCVSIFAGYIKIRALKCLLLVDI